MKKVINPVYFYAILWTAIFILFSLKYSYLLLELNDKITFYIFFSCLAFLCPAFFFSFFTYRYKTNFSNVRHFSNACSLMNTKKILLFFVSCICIELYFFGLFPFFGTLGFNTLRYTDWGFRGFHGLLNGILMAYAIINYGYFIKIKNKKYLIVFLLCLLWPILLMTRQMLMSIFVQCFFVHYYFVGFKLKNVFKIGLFFFLIILIFGFLGDLRSEGFNALAAPTEKYPSFLPSGFLWVYIYITTPLNNILYNIDNYALFQFSISDAFGGLLPSSIRGLMLTSKDTEFELVNEFLNVSSCHKTFLAGFGFIGSLFYQLFLSFIISIFYIKYKFKVNNIKYCFINAVLAHNIAMSFFFDFFTSLVFLSEIFFVYLFFTRIHIR
jgi:oligosaccharide repeat unit polymerase